MANLKKMTTGAMAAVALYLGGCFCGAGPSQSEASLYLTDGATGQPVRSPTFAEKGQTISARCGEADPTDATLCQSEVLVLSVGAHSITVSAPGYQDATVAVDTSTMDSVHLAVALHAAN
jgi:hypothetical protein